MSLLRAKTWQASSGKDVRAASPSRTDLTSYEHSNRTARAQPSSPRAPRIGSSLCSPEKGLNAVTQGTSSVQGDGDGVADST
jgi:hypothetical protein